ncbi:MAG TPA: hypothetical protein PKE55_06270 [Kiritimatiellia bacterium]|nr:hypothetical protein [Kiritimatiellia bacterium]
MSAYEVNFSDWIQRAFRLYVDNIAVLIIASLITVVLSVASFSVLAGPMVAGLLGIVLRAMDREGPKPEVIQLFDGFKVFLPALLFSVGLSLSGGILMAMFRYIPVIGLPIGYGLVVGLVTLTLFTMPHIVEGGLDLVSALKKSVEMIRPALLPMMGYTLVIGILGAVGVMALGIGIAVTMPFYLCGQAVAYRAVLRSTTGG